MRSIQVNIDRPELHDQPDQLLALLGRLAGHRRPGHGRRLLLLLPRRQLRDAAVQAEDDDPPGRRPQGDPARRQPGAAVRPAGPAPGDANIKSIAVTLPQRLRDRPAPPRQHLLGERTGRDRVRRPQRRSARRRRRRRCSTSRSSGPVYAVSGSGGLPRLAFILNGQVDLVPRADTKTVARRPPADDRPGRPRRPDRPLPPDRLRRQARLPASTPATSAPTRRSPQVDFVGQNGRPPHPAPQGAGARARGKAGTRAGQVTTAIDGVGWGPPA